MNKFIKYIKAVSEYWKTGMIIAGFLGSLLGSYLAWASDYSALKFVQNAQADTIRSHGDRISHDSSRIYKNELILATLPNIKETIDRIDGRVDRIEAYLMPKREK